MRDYLSSRHARNMPKYFFRGLSRGRKGYDRRLPWLVCLKLLRNLFILFVVQSIPERFCGIDREAGQEMDFSQMEGVD